MIPLKNHPSYLEIQRFVRSLKKKDKNFLQKDHYLPDRIKNLWKGLMILEDDAEQDVQLIIKISKISFVIFNNSDIWMLIADIKAVDKTGLIDYVIIDLLISHYFVLE